jgi:hypothetical protein
MRRGTTVCSFGISIASSDERLNREEMSWTPGGSYTLRVLNRLHRIPDSLARDVTVTSIRLVLIAWKARKVGVRIVV